MPFIKRTLFVETRQKAFRYLIHELGYTQQVSQRLIAKGRLLINGEAMIKTTQEIEGEIEFISFVPETRGLKPVVVEEEFCAFDKPSGVLIHPQNRYTPYSLIDELKSQFGEYANITHRIDQETSGLVLCALNKESERTLKIMFQDREIFKSYLALVHGHVSRETLITEPLLRAQDESAIVRMVVKVHPDGKKSETKIEPLEYFPDLNMTLVKASPKTGRQHQIRVHLFHVKHPIVGDPIYGQSEENIVKFLDRELSALEREKLSGASRLLLHANTLNFDFKDKNYTLQSDLDFRTLSLELAKKIK